MPFCSLTSEKLNHIKKYQIELPMQNNFSLQSQNFPLCLFFLMTTPYSSQSITASYFKHPIINPEICIYLPALLVR